MNLWILTEERPKVEVLRMILNTLQKIMGVAFLEIQSESFLF